MSNLALQSEGSRSTDCPACPGKPVLERIETRAAQIGEGFTIRRALPTRQRRMVGAWCFLDHAGPADYGPGKGLHVGPTQPATGVIGPGDVQWMTAASGVLHEEFHSPAFTQKGGTLEMAQLWVNLPARKKMSAPRYQAILDAQMPVIALPKVPEPCESSPATTRVPRARRRRA